MTLESALLMVPLFPGTPTDTDLSLLPPTLAPTIHHTVKNRSVGECWSLVGCHRVGDRRW